MRWRRRRRREGDSSERPRRGHRCCFEWGGEDARVVGPRGVASGPSGFGIGTDAYLVRRRINIAAVTGASLGY
jgi:hypothetical protein